MGENNKNSENGNCFGIIIFASITLFFAFPFLRALFESGVLKYLVIGAIILLLLNFLASDT